jgi:hypothetical protein
MDEIYFNGNKNHSSLIPTDIGCAKEMNNELFDNPSCLRITKFAKSIELRRIYIKNLLLLNTPAISIESYPISNI